MAIRRGSGLSRADLSSQPHVSEAVAARRMRDEIFAGFGRLRLLLRRVGVGGRNVVQHGHKPALGLGHAPALSACIVLDLVALDLADAEILRFLVAEIESRYGRARPHGKT